MACWTCGLVPGSRWRVWCPHRPSHPPPASLAVNTGKTSMWGPCVRCWAQQAECTRQTRQPLLEPGQGCGLQAGWRGRLPCSPCLHSSCTLPSAHTHRPAGQLRKVPQAALACMQTCHPPLTRSRKCHNAHEDEEGNWRGMQRQSRQRCFAAQAPPDPTQDVSCSKQLDSRCSTGLGCMGLSVPPTPGVATYTAAGMHPPR